MRLLRRELNGEPSNPEVFRSDDDDDDYDDDDDDDENLGTPLQPMSSYYDIAFSVTSYNAAKKHCWKYPIKPQRHRCDVGVDQ